MAKLVYEICSHYIEYYSGLSETLVSEVTDPIWFILQANKWPVSKPKCMSVTQTWHFANPQILFYHCPVGLFIHFEQRWDDDVLL